MVEIITSKKQMPSFGWQKFIVTTKARNQINRYLRKTRDDESIKIGTELLTKTLRRMKLYGDFEEFKNSYNKFGFADSKSLLMSLGTGMLTVRDMFRKIRPKEDISEKSILEKNPIRFSIFQVIIQKG